MLKPASNDAAASQKHSFLPYLPFTLILLIKVSWYAFNSSSGKGGLQREDAISIFRAFDPSIQNRLGRLWRTNCADGDVVHTSHGSLVHHSQLKNTPRSPLGRSVLVPLDSTEKMACLDRQCSNRRCTALISALLDNYHLQP